MRRLSKACLELCPYTSMYNEPPLWSASGFLPPNWPWWAWHSIVEPLWESHYQKAPQWQLQSKILRDNLVKCHTTLPQVSEKPEESDACQCIWAGQIPTPLRVSPYRDEAAHVPKIYINVFRSAQAKLGQVLAKCALKASHTKCSQFLKTREN